jgi:hypothetical protein
MVFLNFRFMTVAAALNPEVFDEEQGRGESSGGQATTGNKASRLESISEDS